MFDHNMVNFDILKLYSEMLNLAKNARLGQNALAYYVHKEKRFMASVAQAQAEAWRQFIVQKKCLKWIWKKFEKWIETMSESSREY